MFFPYFYHQTYNFCHDLLLFHSPQTHSNNPATPIPTGLYLGILPLCLPSSPFCLALSNGPFQSLIILSRIGLFQPFITDRFNPIAFQPDRISTINLFP
jgi:hypothetical protein